MRRIEKRPGRGRSAKSGHRTREIELEIVTFATSFDIGTGAIWRIDDGHRRRVRKNARISAPLRSVQNGADSERCRSFAYLRIGLDVVGILRNGRGMSPRDNKQISKAPAPCSWAPCSCSRNMESSAPAPLLGSRSQRRIPRSMAQQPSRKRVGLLVVFDSHFAVDQNVAVTLRALDAPPFAAR